MRLIGERREVHRRGEGARRVFRLTGQGVACAVVFALAFGGPTWLWRSGWLSEAAGRVGGSAIGATAEIGLTIEEIRIEGWVHTPRKGLVGALDMHRGDPILAFDPVAVRARLEALPWVQHAAVERRLPKTVIIRLTERRPMALWQRDGKLTLVDDRGMTMPGIATGQYRHLVVLVGSDAAKLAPALFTMLSREPALRKRVRAAVRIGSRRWDLKLSNGVDVRLPEDDATAAWRRLGALDRRHGLLARDIKLIDMRLPDQLIIRTGPAPPAPPPARRGKST